MHVDLAINVSPLMALRTRRKPFSLENPRGEISIVNLGRGGGVGRAKSAKKMDGAGHERDERLQDVQLSPRFERNGYDPRPVDGYWLRARFSFEAGTIGVSGHQSSTRFLAVHSRRACAPR